MIVIAGAAGQVARHLVPLLLEDGERVRGLVRRRDQAAALEAMGAEAALCDLELDEDLGEHVRDATTVIFAAGAGQHSGPERKRTVDLGAALKLIDAATKAGGTRYVMLSSVGAHDAGSLGESRRPYVAAKAEADAALTASGLPFTIVRPGFLNDDGPTGRVEVTTELGRFVAVEPGVRREIPRADVAAVLRECVRRSSTIGLTFEVFAGELPVADAIAGLPER
jgi:uncharacterized protein YbjT (DUF2867 family)